MARPRASQIASPSDPADVWRRLHAAPDVLEAITEAEGLSELALQQRLRRDWPDDLVRAALSLVDFRRRARDKFPHATDLWGDRTGLEQATPAEVARHKAQRFDARTWDLCCGLGGDTLALAATHDVLAVDRDPACCLWTRWNAEAAGVASRVQIVCADVAELVRGAGPHIAKDLVHVDPDRRAGPGGSTSSRGSTGRDGRSRRVEDLSPGLDVLRDLVARFRGGAIKLSPASNFGGKFPEAEIELTSLRGECKEATVWFGALRGPHAWRATVLPQGATLSGDPLESVAEIAPLGRFLFDPDPAIVRAGLVDLAAVQAGLSRLDPAEEYLTGDAPCDSPFVRAFEVLKSLPNRDTEIRRWFREHPVGEVEVKCRHVPIDAEAVRRRLPLEGSGSVALIFARVEGRVRAVATRRVVLGGD